MAGLDDLPVEVLAEILSRLPSLEDSFGSQHYSSKQDFYNISLCSRRLHEIVEVPLYAYIDGSCSVTVALLTRTLLDRPRLALLIREAMIEVKNGIDMAPTNEELMGSFGHDSLRSAVNATGVPICEGGPWVADFKAGRSDAREALLLSMLPNLRALSLNVSSPLQYINNLAGCVLERAMPSRSTAPSSTDMQRERTCQHAFASLEDVRIETLSSLAYDEALPIMNLPSLHRLYTYGLSTSRYNWEPPPESSVVQDLELHGCEMMEEELFWMLRSCRALRTLEYEWNQSPWSEEVGRDDEWDYGIALGPIIIEGLASSKPSLQALLVNGLDAIRNDVMSFGSLLDFENIKTIRAPSVLILNRSRDGIKRRLVDVLPAALETLHLINDGLPGEGPLIAELLELVRSERRSKTLHHITVEHIGRHTIKFPGASDVTRLEAACAKVGTSFALQLPTYSGVE